MPSLKEYPHNLTKYESRIQKSQFSNSYVNWEKFGRKAQANIQKQIFHLFHELEKTEKSK